MKNEISTHEQGEPQSKIPMLSTILRRLGMLIVIAGVATFMFQKWESASHISRYLMFLGFTGTLAALGVFAGLKLKETKGARMFIALAGAMATVSFCQLSALIYSRFGNPIADMAIPRYLMWVAPNDVSVFVSAVVGLVVLIPITYFSFKVLAREHAATLTLASLAGNIALLIPFRAADFTGIMSFTLLAGLIYHERIILKRPVSMKNTEGYICHAITVLPVVFFMGRAVHLYNPTFVFYGLIYLSIALLLFAFVARLVENLKHASYFEKISVLPLLIGILLVIIGIKENNLFINNDIFILVYTLISAAAVFILSNFTELNSEKFKSWSSNLVLIGIPLQMVYGGVPLMVVIFGLLLLTAVISYAQKTSNLSMLGLSIMQVIILLGIFTVNSVTITSQVAWLGLAALGITIMLVASVIEKNGLTQGVNLILRDKLGLKSAKTL